MLYAAARSIEYGGAVVGGVAAAICALYLTKSAAQNAGTAAKSTSDAAPIFGSTIPPGYRP